MIVFARNVVKECESPKRSLLSVDAERLGGEETSP